MYYHSKKINNAIFHVMKRCYELEVDHPQKVTQGTQVPLNYCPWLAS